MKFLKDESGQAVLEFAIIAPILLLILCCIIDSAWILSAKLATDNCAREGTRYASLSTSYSTAQEDTAQRVYEVATNTIRNDLSTTVTYSSPHDPESGDVTVEVVAQVKTLTIIASTVMGGKTVKLTSRVTMRVG